MDLTNKKILLTGGSGGIGSLIKDKLKFEGAMVMTPDRAELDLCDKTSVDSYVAKYKEFGFDILINCAGVGVYKNLKDITDEDWKRSIDINLTGPFKLMRDLLPKELVLNIGSGAGVMPFKGRGAYCATKFGLRGLTLSLAQELASPRFCLITLGSVLTNFGNLTVKEKLDLQKTGKPYFTPEFVADKIVEIIKDDNRQVEIELYP